MAAQSDAQGDNSLPDEPLVPDSTPVSDEGPSSDPGGIPDSGPAADTGPMGPPETTVLTEGTNCPTGYFLSYGQCVPNPNKPPGSGGGCAMSGDGWPPHVWLLMLVPASLFRRRTG